MILTTLKNRLKKVLRRNILEKTLRQQPYFYTYEDIKIEVEKDVFPPDIGFASVYLAEELKKYSVQSALDMGTGTGFIAIMMRKNKIRNVVAVDNHLPAIKCCKKNLELNQLYSDIKLVFGNLFDKINNSIKFDLIVFNHPYSPATNKIVFGNGMDGGREICTKFLSEAKNFLSKNGVILMSFSSIFNIENDPLYIAKEIGYNAKVLLSKKDRLATNYIYEFRLN